MSSHWLSTKSRLASWTGQYVDARVETPANVPKTEPADGALLQHRAPRSPSSLFLQLVWRSSPRCSISPCCTSDVCILRPSVSRMMRHDGQAWLHYQTATLSIWLQEGRKWILPHLGLKDQTVKSYWLMTTDAIGYDRSYLAAMANWIVESISARSFIAVSQPGSLLPKRRSTAIQAQPWRGVWRLWRTWRYWSHGDHYGIWTNDQSIMSCADWPTRRQRSNNSAMVKQSVKNTKPKQQ